MKKHFNEEELEKLALKIIRQVNSVSDEFKVLFEHLNDCLVCKKKFEFFSKYYELYEIEISKPSFKKINEIALTFKSGNIIPLKKIKIGVDESLLGNSKQIKVLAAYGKDLLKGRFISVANYSSKDNDILARIVEDTSKQLITIYILATEIENSNEVMIAIQKDDENVMLFATDYDGKANLKSEDKIDWDRSALFIYKPIATIDFNDRINTDEFKKDNRIFTFCEKDNGMKLKFNAIGEEKILNALIIYDDNSNSIEKVYNNEIEISNKKKIKKIKMFN